MGIEDIPDIQTETKKSLGGHLPDVGKPLVVEILLRTPESESLVLEIWTLTVLDACDTSPARVNPTIYNRMTVSGQNALWKGNFFLTRGNLITSVAVCYSIKYYSCSYIITVAPL